MSIAPKLMTGTIPSIPRTSDSTSNSMGDPMFLTLEKRLDAVQMDRDILNFFQRNIPAHVIGNLNPKFEPRSYQLEAWGRFKYVFSRSAYNKKDAPLQVLFHMATGSGKTLVMAGLVLYLYKKGYRNFLFFVNRDNIIHKTRENFLNITSTKFLFNKEIRIDDKKIEINEVNNFQVGENEQLNIVFTTVQGLHTRLENPRENSITFDDFGDQKIVLISDEAHHINAETKQYYRLTNYEKKEKSSWEGTVERIVSANKLNVLLEFTATMDLSHQGIAEKYKDRLIFDYPLSKFRVDGYSKEVKVLEADMVKFDRAVQAMLLSQVRRKIFNKHKLLIKPVILFKSKTINDSRKFFNEFKNKLEQLDGDYLQRIKNIPNLDRVLVKTFEYFKDADIELDNLALELKEEFAENKCISIDSKSESESKQIVVNTLEDKNNEYRAVFAVDKLNEGWDVLNLFDIVRLYDTRDSKYGKVGKTTISEAQLIGRGARYCPFRLSDDQDLYKRKFDVCSEQEEELKLCEELYYHSKDNPRYIHELKSALKETGIMPEQRETLTLKIKGEFHKKPFYKDGVVYKNTRLRYDRRDIYGISESFSQEEHKFPLLSNYSQSSNLFGNAKPTVPKSIISMEFLSFGEHVIRKAMMMLPEFHFKNLRKWYPNLISSSEFIRSEHYLGQINIAVTGYSLNVDSLSQDNKLDLAICLLKKLSKRLNSEKVDYNGSREFSPVGIRSTFTSKTIFREKLSEQNRLDLSDRPWFLFENFTGTSEEKNFIEYMEPVIQELETKYDQVYLIRNERHLKIFNFDDGKGFEPDFVLFLLNESNTEGIQIFVEPKGKHLFEKDQWKNEFLQRIKREHKTIKNLFNDENIEICGIQFYNSEHQKEFDKSLRELISLEDKSI